MKTRSLSVCYGICLMFLLFSLSSCNQSPSSSQSSLTSKTSDKQVSFEKVGERLAESMAREITDLKNEIDTLQVEIAQTSNPFKREDLNIKLESKRKILQTLGERNLNQFAQELKLGIDLKGWIGRLTTITNPDKSGLIELQIESGTNSYYMKSYLDRDKLRWLSVGDMVTFNGKVEGEKSKDKASNEIKKPDNLKVLFANPKWYGYVTDITSSQGSELESRFAQERKHALSTIANFIKDATSMIAIKNKDSQDEFTNNMIAYLKAITDINSFVRDFIKKANDTSSVLKDSKKNKGTPYVPQKIIDESDIPELLTQFRKLGESIISTYRVKEWDGQIVSFGEDVREQVDIVQTGVLAVVNTLLNGGMVVIEEIKKQTKHPYIKAEFNNLSWILYCGDRQKIMTLEKGNKTRFSGKITGYNINSRSVLIEVKDLR